MDNFVHPSELIRPVGGDGASEGEDGEKARRPRVKRGNGPFAACWSQLAAGAGEDEPEEDEPVEDDVEAEDDEGDVDEPEDEELTELLEDERLSVR